jgi:hypothetical protein
MVGGSVGCRAALASRRLTPEPISSSPGTGKIAAVYLFFDEPP